MITEKIRINAIVDAPIEKVWEYWTKPEHIVNWNFAGDEWCCPSAANDLKVGGIYTSRMEAKDGSFGFDFKVVYNEVSEYKFISYTMEDGRQAETTFKVSEDGVEMTTLFDAESENSRELQQQGWQSILNNFKNYTQNN
jgi:uncharacterized protein YndB with AHSA1/START domain